MKKTITLLIAIFMLFAFGGLASVHASFIKVEGFVNPYQGTYSSDGTNTTFSEVGYFFNVVDAGGGALLDFIQLEMDSAVFDTLTPISSSSPVDWTFSPTPAGTSSNWEGYAGTPLGAGEQLSFVMRDLVVRDSALINPGLWQEGQIWAQSWSAVSYEPFAVDGGSTSAAAVVPEPGTLILFGSGLVGLYFVRRQKVFNI